VAWSGTNYVLSHFFLALSCGRVKYFLPTGHPVRKKTCFSHQWLFSPDRNPPCLGVRRVPG